MDADIVGRADFYYVGAFDDEIQRYKKTNLDLTIINEILSQAVLYSGRLLIADGYLMLYPAGRLALVDRTASPLLDLIDARWIRLYSRNDGRLADMPREMDHIETYRELLSSPEWVDLEPKLRRLQSHLEGKSAVECWPKVNVGPGFQRLVNLAFEGLDRRSFEGQLTPQQADRVLEEFNSELKSDPNLPARQVWRQTYERPDFALSESGKSFLHWLGIEAYHYNLTMTSCLNESKRRPGLITRYSCFFNALRERPLSSMPGGAGLSEIPTPTLPRGIPREALYHGGFLKEVVTFGTELEREKQGYLDAVQAALRDKEALPDVRKAADSYGTSLGKFLKSHDASRQLGDSIRTPLEIVMKVGATAGLGLAGGAILGGPVGAIAGGLIGWVGSRVVISGTRKMLDTPVPLVVDLTESVEDYAEAVPTLSEPYQGPQWFASFMLRPDAAKEHVKALPLYFP